jgi:tetratricopeptide (TPR) repeat protein
MLMEGREERLARAVGLRQAGEAEEARVILLALVDERPEDAEVLYQTAWTHDTLGLEREAVAYYRRALDAGLAGEERRGALLGLGSTYRALGEYVRAEETLRQGVVEFPDDRAMQVFLAMALYNRGRHGEAMGLVLRNLAETSDDTRIRRYERAILYYAPDLDRTWE